MATTHEIGQSTMPSVSGWTIGFVTFSGAMMVLSGVFQIFEGVAAIFNKGFFIVGSNYIYTLNIATWGWIHLIMGSIVALAGVSIFSGSAWARGVGIVLALISATANFFYVPYYPVWTLLIIALDIAIIWSLAIYGPEQAASLDE